MTDEEQLKRDGFYLSTPEYALMLNISTEALRSRRRRGELEGEYKSDGKEEVAGSIPAVGTIFLTSIISNYQITTKFFPQ